MNRGYGFRIFAIALIVFIITSSLLLQYTTGVFEDLTMSSFVKGLFVGIEWGSLIAMIIGAFAMVFKKEAR